MPRSGDLRRIRFDRDGDNRGELSLAGDDIKEKRRDHQLAVRRGPPGRAVAVGDRDDDRRHLQVRHRLLEGPAAGRPLQRGDG
ncbi:hypothetical protein G6F46_014803 [Rhizopus delemar]|nr:hypothetical protein G6F46_014803 [Rhizopus delemar]